MCALILALCRLWKTLIRLVWIRQASIVNWHASAIKKALALLWESNQNILTVAQKVVDLSTTDK